MKVITSSPYRQQKRQPNIWLKRSLWAIGGLIILFVASNLIIWIIYRDRVLPNVEAAKLPKTITLTYQQATLAFDVQKAGITVDEAATKERLKKERTWLPLLDIFTSRKIPAVLAVQKQSFVEVLRMEVEPAFLKPALAKRIVFSGDKFTLAEPEPGYRLDEEQFTKRIKEYTAAGRTKLTVPVLATSSDDSGAGLEAVLPALNEKLKTKIIFMVNGQVKQPSVADMGAWFNLGRYAELSQDSVKAYVLNLAPGITNGVNAAAAVSYAFDKKVDITFVLATNAPVRYTYCASSKGVADSHMPNFIAKVAATLGDPRGWNASGKISFERVDSNCDFTVWLSAPSYMTSFGGVCDSYYSCRSGRNVVINFDRWQGATDPWNASGGSLEDYRVMVTNHEVGHWLGFGHSNCSGPGQPAPVMQQQSISLQGCVFNPWPTSGEINTLKQNKGVASLQPREEYIAQSKCSCGHHA